MVLTQQEENKNKAISAGLTALIFLLLLLFLIWFQLITPNPPFPETGGGGGQELALGMMNMGNDNVDYGSMGSIPDMQSQKSDEKILKVDDGEDVPLVEEKIVHKKKNKVVKEEKKKQIEKEETEAEKLSKKFKKNKNKNGGGVGNNFEAGENGSPDGSPTGTGNGGSGSGSGGGNGDGEGTGTGSGKGSGFGGGKIGIDLKGRMLVRPPQLPKDTKEEGKVVVEITVDTEGNVIEANPNGRGTSTSSPILKAKAKQAALNTKFDINGKFDEQHGTITIIFSFD